MHIKGLKQYHSKYYWSFEVDRILFRSSLKLHRREFHTATSKNHRPKPQEIYQIFMGYFYSGFTVRWKHFDGKVWKSNRSYYKSWLCENPDENVLYKGAWPQLLKWLRCFSCLLYKEEECMTQKSIVQNLAKCEYFLFIALDSCTFWPIINRIVKMKKKIYVATGRSLKITTM